MYKKTPIPHTTDSMSDCIFINPQLLSYAFQERSPLIMAFQDQSTEIGFKKLRNRVVRAMKDEGYMYQDIQCEDYFGVFAFDDFEGRSELLYTFCGHGHSVVLSPTGAHSAVGNVHIYSMGDWEILRPWLGLGDLVELDANV